MADKEDKQKFIPANSNGFKVHLSQLARKKRKSLVDIITPPQLPFADSTFMLARNTTSDLSGTTSFDVQIKVNQSIGVAPMAVTFDAITNSSFAGISKPERDLSFWWDFDDSGAVFENIESTHPMGNSADQSNQVYTGHVFDSVGTHTVKCMVFDHVTGNVGYATIDIIVADADASFPTTQTICYDPSGTFTGAPSGAQQFTDFDLAFAEFNKLGDKRFLFARGSDTDFTATKNISAAGRKYVGAFGTGDLPILRPTYALGVNQRMFQVQNHSDAGIFYDLDVVGDYDPVTGTGDTWSNFFTAFQPAENKAIWHCKTAGVAYTNYIFNPVTDGGHVIQDNLITDWHEYGLFIAESEAVVRGNSIKQNASAVNGTGAKNNIEYQVVGDNATTLYTHGMDLFGDAATNLVVYKRNVATDALTLMVAGVDYTFTETTVTYTVAPTSSEYAYMHHRRWANHGSIRNGNSTMWHATHNDLLSNVDWSNILSEQPCIRVNTGGVASINLVTGNRCEGGLYIITTSVQNPSETVDALSTIIESNYLIASAVTNAPVDVATGGVTVRNNVAYRGDFAKVAFGLSFQSFAYIRDYGVPSPASVAEAINVYNNTIINLQSTANGIVDMSHVVDASTFPTVNEGNGLVYAPDNPTPLTDYTPIDLTNYGRLKDGSAAIDAGTNVQQIVFDDFFGDVRGTTNSLGAGDNVGAVRFQADGVDDFISFDDVCGASEDFSISFYLTISALDPNNYIGADSEAGVTSSIVVTDVGVVKFRLPLTFSSNSPSGTVVIGTRHLYEWVRVGTDVTLSIDGVTACTMSGSTDANTMQYLMTGINGKTQGILEELVIVNPSGTRTFNLDTVTLGGNTIESVEGGDFVTMSAGVDANSWI